MAEPKKPHQINTSVSDDTWLALEQIHRVHGHKPVDFARLMIEAGVALYKAQKFFAFPVEVIPSKELLENAARFRDALAVAEEAGTYRASPLPSARALVKESIASPKSGSSSAHKSAS